MIRKLLVFIGSSRDDLSRFPEEVKVDIGYALHEAQMGLKRQKTITTLTSGAGHKP